MLTVVCGSIMGLNLNFQQREANVGLGTLISNLLGGGNKEPKPAEAAEPVDHKGFSIVAAPLKEGSQYKTAGSISKEIDGQLKSVQFIRADNHADRQSAVTHSERKGQQIVDEQGERMFERANV